MNNEASDQPDPVSGGKVVLFGAYLILLNLSLFYILVKIWPGKLPIPDNETVDFLWGHAHLQLWIERRYMLIVAVAGALGSYIHLATSFSDYLGNRRFYKSWLWWYLLRPFIGMALAMTLYFAVRGGLIAGTTGAGNLSPYGVAAIAGLAGMFSRQATDKLREVFETLFRTVQTPARADSLQSSVKPADKPAV